MLPLDKFRPWNKCHAWQIAAWVQNAFNPFQTPPKAISRYFTFLRVLHWHMSACCVWPCINEVGNQRGVAPDQSASMAVAHPAAEFLGPSSLTAHLGGISSPQQHTWSADDVSELQPWRFGLSQSQWQVSYLQLHTIILSANNFHAFTIILPPA